MIRMTRFSTSRKIAYINGEWRTNPNLYKRIEYFIRSHNPTLTNQEVEFFTKRLDYLFKEDQEIFDPKWLPSIRLPGNKKATHMCIHNMLKKEYGLPFITNKASAVDNDFYQKEIVAENVKTYHKKACILLEKDIIYGDKFFLTNPYNIYSAKLHNNITNDMLTDYFLEKKYCSARAVSGIYSFLIEHNFNKSTIDDIMSIYDLHP